METEIIYLDRNENHYGPAPRVFELLSSLSKNQLSIYSKDFARGVKCRLTERLAYDYGIPEWQIVPGYGSEDLLKQVVHCYLGPSKTIMIPQQSWWYYKKIAGEVGGRQVEYALRKGVKTFQYDLQHMLEVFNRNKPSVVLLSSPNNPTGNSLNRDQLVFLLEKMNDAVVVLDEAYLGFNGTKNHYAKELIEAFPRLAILRTFSKYYALAGVRIGYAFVGKGLSELLNFSARYLGYNRVSEEIAIAALDSEPYYETIRQKMVADKEMYYRGFDELPGFTAYRSDANFILVEFPPRLKTALKQALEAKLIRVKFFDEQQFENFMRITIGTEVMNHFLMDTITSVVKAQYAPVVR
ncbi:MAG: pyridoxal phosphate-dependent aminotransferase [Bacteroidota bacterium]